MCVNFTTEQAVHLAPKMLYQLEQVYTYFGDIENPWRGRFAQEGQGMLAALRDLIAKATGRDEREVQDDYCTRAKNARMTRGGGM